MEFTIYAIDTDLLLVFVLARYLELHPPLIFNRFAPSINATI